MSEFLKKVEEVRKRLRLRGEIASGGIIERVLDLLPQGPIVTKVKGTVGDVRRRARTRVEELRERIGGFGRR